MIAAGLTPQPAEALLVAEIADLATDVGPPPGVDLLEVVDRHGVEGLISVHDEVFGGDHAALGQTLLAGLEHQLVLPSPPGVWSSTMELTSPACGAAARRRPFGAVACSARWWPTVALWPRPKASPTSRSTPPRDSRPILLRLGFVELATTTPFSTSAEQADGPSASRVAHVLALKVDLTVG